MKICSRCVETKTIECFEFRKDINDYRGVCRTCRYAVGKEHYKNNQDKIVNYRNKTREHRLAKMRSYHKENKAIISERKKNYRAINKENIAIKQKEYRKINRERLCSYLKVYYKEHKKERSLYKEKYKEKIAVVRRAYVKKITKENKQYNIEKRLRGRFNKLINGRNKSSSVSCLIGCSYTELLSHLEKTFYIRNNGEEMTWDSFFNGQLHIDHIVPLCSFDLTDESQQKIAWNYKNLRFLWKEDNLKKSIEDKKLSIRLKKS